MAVSAEVGEILNSQINKELYSSYLYMTFADHFEVRGLRGFANWYMIQAREEVAHALILRRYLFDNNFTPKMETVAQPTLTLDSDLEVIEAAYDHEKYITKCINECYSTAYNERDYRTMQLLDWFVREQNEEEVNAGEMVTNMKLFGGSPDGLYALDREYAGRSYKAPSDFKM